MGAEGKIRVYEHDEAICQLKTEEDNTKRQAVEKARLLCQAQKTGE